MNHTTECVAASARVREAWAVVDDHLVAGVHGPKLELVTAEYHAAWDGLEKARAKCGCTAPNHSSVTSCHCQHAQMWHKPDCRIAGCECRGFVQATIRVKQDAAWMRSARVGKGRSKAKATE